MSNTLKETMLVMGGPVCRLPTPLTALRREGTALNIITRWDVLFIGEGHVS